MREIAGTTPARIGMRRKAGRNMKIGKFGLGITIAKSH
jgi:hypothetical protein